VATLIYATPSSSRDQRRWVLMASAQWKGLDSVAVDGSPRPEPGGGMVWRLRLSFVPASRETPKSPIPANLGPSHLRVLLEGVPDPYVTVQEVLPGPDAASLTAVVRKESPAIFPQDPPAHVLELVALPDVDPVFSSAPFRFQEGASSSWTAPRMPPEAEPLEAYDADYMAKDFESFRQLILERMAFFIPEWKERNASDLGVTIIEVLAYAADYLSYYQDSVATEAYLGTARRRISVRRHARLLDFRMVEGTNARAWVQVWVDRAPGKGGGARPLPVFSLPAGTGLLTRSRVPDCVYEGSREYSLALEQGALVFQTLVPASLHPDHNQIDLYTWGAKDFTLSAGSTGAALRGHLEHLQAGDVLVLEKRVGRRLEEAEPLDPKERQAVRLSRAPVLSHDSLTGADFTQVTWFDEDALTIDFPVSRLAGRVLQERLSLVRGNIVPADQGEVVEDPLPPVPELGRYDALLPRVGLTFRQPFDAAAAQQQPASRTLGQVAWQALPDIELLEVPEHVHSGDERGVLLGLALWRPRHDLLNSGRFARDFVVEMNDEGYAQLRFGDGQAGRRPAAGVSFLARYRVGVGARGNVGAHAIHHVVLGQGLRLALKKAELIVRFARNHLPGEGGSGPKPSEHAQVYAPDIIHSFAVQAPRGPEDDPATTAQRQPKRTVTSQPFQRRCVTADDHARVAERYPEVMRAVARQRWSGNSITVDLYIQREGGRPVDDAFQAQLRRFMEPFLMAGGDLVLRDPLWVPLEIQMTLTLGPGVRTEEVYPRLFTEQGAHRFFNPDDFTFGQPVYLSRLTTLMMAVPGVADLRVDMFQRWGQPAAGEIDAGFIPIGPLEIARFAISPAAPQHGAFRVRFVEAG
jgi:hypothetical protein